MAKINSIQLRPKTEQDIENIYNYSLREFVQNRTNQYIKRYAKYFS